jgi:molybdopterin converting factor small subunit
VAGEQIQVEVRILPWFSEILAPGQHTSLVFEEALPSGSLLRRLLTRLAARDDRFGEAIYDPRSDVLRATVVITHNGQLVPPGTALDLTLQDADSVALIPAYCGG